jgi:hypothetical protein
MAEGNLVHVTAACPPEMTERARLRPEATRLRRSSRKGQWTNWHSSEVFVECFERPVSRGENGAELKGSKVSC